MRRPRDPRSGASSSSAAEPQGGWRLPRSHASCRRGPASLWSNPMRSARSAWARRRSRKFACSIRGSGSTRMISSARRKGLSSSASNSSAGRVRPAVSRAATSMLSGRSGAGSGWCRSTSIGCGIAASAARADCGISRRARWRRSMIALRATWVGPISRVVSPGRSSSMPDSMPPICGTMPRRAAWCGTRAASSRSRRMANAVTSHR